MTHGSAEVVWIDQIDAGFVDPSLVFCAKGHTYPDGENVMGLGKSGRIPDLLRERKHDVEVVSLESENPQRKIS